MTVATPQVLFCPECDEQHIDSDEWATRLHRTHLCARCGHEWRPSEEYTVGVYAKEQLLTPEQAKRFVDLVWDETHVRPVAPVLPFVGVYTGQEQAAAVLSADERRRFLLRRGEGPRLGLIMLNPSTADASQDDPTIRKCKGFAERMGLTGIIVANLFSYRATEPKDLVIALKAGEPAATPDCDAAIAQVCREADVVAFAWGNLTGALKKFAVPRVQVAIAAATAAGKAPIVLGRTKTGEPRHPLMLGYASTPEPYSIS